MGSKKVRGISRYFKGSQNISWDLMRAHEISISNHDIGGNEDIFDIVDIVDTDMRFFKKNCRTADCDSRDVVDIT